MKISQDFLNHRGAETQRKKDWNLFARKEDAALRGQIGWALRARGWSIFLSHFLCLGASAVYFWLRPLARISHQVSTAAADPGMSAALRSVGLPDVLSSTPADPPAARLVSMPVCAASLRNLVRNAG